MKFCMENAMDEFDFKESVIREMQFGVDSLKMIFDNVRIPATNSLNRDIVDKRANAFLFTIGEIQEVRLFEEAYTVFDADLNPYRNVPERQVEPDEMRETLEDLGGCFIDTFVREKDTYILTIEGEDHTWRFEADGKDNTQAWDRWLGF